MKISEKILRTGLKSFIFGLGFLALMACGGMGGGAAAPGPMGSMDNAATGILPPNNAAAPTDESGFDENEPVARAWIGNSATLSNSGPGGLSPLQNQAQPDVPDPSKNLQDAPPRAEIKPLTEDDLCTLPNDRIKIKFRLQYFFYKGVPINGEHLRVVDRSEHQYLDTKKSKTHNGEDGFISFSIKTTLHVKLDIYMGVLGWTPPEIDKELPCENHECNIPDSFGLVRFRKNLTSLAEHAEPCESEQNTGSEEDH